MQRGREGPSSSWSPLVISATTQLAPSKDQGALHIGIGYFCFEIHHFDDWLWGQLLIVFHIASGPVVLIKTTAPPCGENLGLSALPHPSAQVHIQSVQLPCHPEGNKDHHPPLVGKPGTHLDIVASAMRGCNGP
jgi:hypothetical protein